MLSKGFVFVAAAVLSAFAIPTSGSALPALSGAAPHPEDGQVIKVDYYYSGYYNYRNDPRYYDGYDPFFEDGLLSIPGKVLGAAFGVVTGALGGALHGNPYYDPLYAGSYYGDRYWKKHRHDRWYFSEANGAGGPYGSGYYGSFDGSSDYHHGLYDHAGYYGYGSSNRGARYDGFYDRNDYHSYGSFYRGAGYGGFYDRGDYRSYDSPYWSVGYRGSYDRADRYGYGTYERGGLGACEREFTGFDPETGTYMNRYGERVFCPYFKP